MDKDTLVSVIIPIYNAEPYLRRCIDSILANNSVNIEVLLVDDGSVDDSLAICKEYAKNDNRVRVYTQENRGASSARNTGLKSASGNWITFVDADDHILLNDWSFLQKNESDLIMLPHCTKYKHLYEHHTFPDNISVNNYFEYLRSPCFKTACSKFYRNFLLKDLSFDETIKVGEDQLFLLKYLKKSKSFEVIDKPFYEYQLADISAGRKYHLTIEESVNAMTSIYNAYADLNIHNAAFEADLFQSFKFLCQHQIDKTPEKWYNNSQVKLLYLQMCDSLSLFYRFKYVLLSIPLLSRFRSMLK